MEDSHEEIGVIRQRIEDVCFLVKKWVERG